MNESLYQLTRPLAFVKIIHPNLGFFTWKIPLLASTISAVTYFFLPEKFPILGDKGLNQCIMSIISTLPGFFIAALTVVATFTNDYLDDEMPAPPPRLNFITQGKSEIVPLSMRMFLSYLFAFLTSLSFIIIAMCVLSNLLSPSLKVLASRNFTARFFEELMVFVRAVYIFILSCLVFSIVTVSLLGMYFLSERIHRSNS